MSSSSSRRDPKPDVVTGYPAAAGTAYQYPTAPPSQATPYFPNPDPNPNSYYHNPNPNYNGYYSDPSIDNRNRFIRRLLAFAVAAFVFAGAITFIVWLILRPKLPDFSVSSLDVSFFNISSNSLSGDFDVKFTVLNPNSKMSVGYDEVGAAVLYGDLLLADTTLPPFYQTTGDVSVIKAKLSVAAGYLGDDAAKAIRSDRGDGVLQLGVRFLAVVRFKAGIWRARNHLLRVFCDDIGVGFKNATSGAGSMVGSPKHCQVGL